MGGQISPRWNLPRTPFVWVSSLSVRGIPFPLYTCPASSFQNSFHPFPCWEELQKCFRYALKMIRTRKDYTALLFLPWFQVSPQRRPSRRQNMTVLELDELKSPNTRAWRCGLMNLGKGLRVFLKVHKLKIVTLCLCILYPFPVFLWKIWRIYVCLLSPIWPPSSLPKYTSWRSQVFKTTRSTTVCTSNNLNLNLTVCESCLYLFLWLCRQNQDRRLFHRFAYSSRKTSIQKCFFSAACFMSTQASEISLFLLLLSLSCSCMISILHTSLRHLFCVETLTLRWVRWQDITTILDLTPMFQRSAWTGLPRSAFSLLLANFWPKEHS